MYLFLRLNVHCKCLSYSLHRIDGPHNKTVLVAIQDEMHEHDEDCSLKTVRGEVVCMYIVILHFLYCIGVLATYRKSLCRKQRDSVATTEKRLMRSRQQWVSVYVKRSVISVCLYNVHVWCLSSFNTSQKYDRRSGRVMGSEQEVWQDVAPTMMSDEEDVGSNTFRVHRQEWRSQEMTDMLEELDRRADAAIKNAHPRKDRVVGTPMKVDPPRTTKDWMLRGQDQDLETSNRKGSPTLF